jgi:hypothetical protein
VYRERLGMMEVARAVEKIEFIVFRCNGCVGFSGQKSCGCNSYEVTRVLANVPQSSSQVRKVGVDIRYHGEGL